MKKNAIITVLAIAVLAVLMAKKQKNITATPDNSAALISSATNCSQAIPATSSTSTRLPLLLELGSTTCIPCKTMAPIMDELRTTFSNTLEVTFIDVWADESMAKKYGIKTIPTQIFFDAHGQELFRHQGFMPRADIIAKWAELDINLLK